MLKLLRDNFTKLILFLQSFKSDISMDYFFFDFPISVQYTVLFIYTRILLKEHVQLKQRTKVGVKKYTTIKRIFTRHAC